MRIIVPSNLPNPYLRTFGELKIQLWHADYLDFLSTLPDESVDLILTDPPYGMNWKSNWNQGRLFGKKVKRRKEVRDPTDYDVLKGDAERFSYLPLGREAMRVLKPDSAIFAFTRWDVYPDHFKQFRKAGLKLKEPLLGQKVSSLGDLEGSFRSNCEWALFACKGTFKFRHTQLLRTRNPGTKGGRSITETEEWTKRMPSAWFGSEFPFSSEPASFARTNKIYHPTIKGQRFFEWLIMLCSDAGGLVVDPFSGSGTCAAAAQHTGRNFSGSELDPKHFKTATRRVDRIRKDLFTA